MATPSTALAQTASGPAVVLGSGSRYRRELLARILPSFEVVVPTVDETPEAGESAARLAQRLARLKAERVAESRPAAVVIGGDQVAECDGRLLGKPGSEPRAVEQLMSCAGRSVTLHTAACVIAPGGQVSAAELDQTVMRLRPLSRDEIARYVTRDQPIDCAGSFRFEALGAALFSSVQTRDPTAIQGLPLLWLVTVLTGFGVRVL
jgi:septum formation protein